MSERAAIDLNAIKTFYDPHPGFAGAAIPIPSAVKNVADKLSGKTLPVRMALSRLKKVTKGELKIVIMDISFIMLKIKTGDNIAHGFRVICFR